MPNNWFFDWFAPHYPREVQPAALKHLQRHLKLPSAGHLLDAAGGSGRFGNALRPYVRRVTVCDLSRKMLAQRQEDLPAAQARVERLPFPDASFDAILLVDALHHTGDPAAVIGELARVLAPGGRLVIEEPDIQRAAVKLVALAERLLGMGSRFVKPDAIRALVAACGLAAQIEYDGVTVWVVGRKGLP